MQKYYFIIYLLVLFLLMRVSRSNSRATHFGALAAYYFHMNALLFFFFPLLTDCHIRVVAQKGVVLYVSSSTTFALGVVITRKNPLGVPQDTG